MADDTVTLDDLAEQITHLNESAKRVHDTVYWGRWHERINEALDKWEAAAGMELGE